MISQYKTELLQTNGISATNTKAGIERERNRKIIQYLGEGLTFFILISAGAVIVFRMIRRQLKLSTQQQDFMMAISHELKTPIAVTRLNLETLLKRDLPQAQQNKLIIRSLSETDRLNALCNNMLLLNQMDIGSYADGKEEVELTELAETCIEDFKSRYPFREITVSIEEGVLLWGDNIMIRLAINNLLDNAVKYSPLNSTIHLELIKQVGKIILRVIDQGPGITDEEKQKVFEKYYRGIQARAKGTGLGLYVTQKIVRYNNGAINVTDNHPTGSIFALEFVV